MSSAPVTVFFSYSHQDESLRDELAKHLAILKNNGVIDAWHDRQILPGDEWDGAIKDSLNTAQIILLLISADFIASRYCNEIEIARAMERHEAKEAVVIPVILRSCGWTDGPFSKLQALPKNGTPVISQTWHTPDEAFTNIAKGIKTVANDIRQKIKAAKQAQLDQYEGIYTKAIKQTYPLSESTQNRLKRLQDTLKLSDTDIAPIVTRLATKYGEGKQKLEKYRNEVRECLQEDGGQITDFGRIELDTYRMQYGLTPEEAKAVEEEELHPYTAKQDAIAQYQKVFVQAKIPIDQKTRRRLQRLQRALKLTDEDVQEIESTDDEEEVAKPPEPEAPKVDIGATQNKAQDASQMSESTAAAQYRERVKEYLADRKISPLEKIRLEQLRKNLGLSEAEAAAILAEEQALFEQAKATYRDALNRLIESGHYPLVEATQQELRQLGQELKLTDSEAEDIKRPILDAEKKRRFEQARATYCDALNRLIEGGHYPLDDQTQQELRQLAKELQLTDSEIEAIEQPILDAALEAMLPSERGIDYTRLRDLLKAQNFKDADNETYLRMLEAFGREDGDYLRKDELLNFPCTDLKTIDQLWVKYSDGKFGFSVQKEIYVECGAKLDGNYPGDKIWDKFCDRVGWRVNGNYISYSEVTFSTSAPTAHLPATRVVVEEFVVKEGFGCFVVGGGRWGVIGWVDDMTILNV